MTDSEMFQFLDVFNTLTKVFPFRADGDEARDIGRAYFKTLRKFPLELVKIGADNCIASMEKFPKPAEWVKHIPKRLPGPELAPLNTAESLEWRDAEQRGYEGDPCRCRDCHEAGVSDKPTRFVPNDPDERAMLGDRVILRGHWIHADDLRRWYAAKDAFWALFHTGVGAKTMAPKMLKKMSAQERIEAVFASKTKQAIVEREPGEEG
jgi:hypothetical protein